MPSDEASKFAREREILFMETSGTHGIKVKEVFEAVVSTYLDRLNNKTTPKAKTGKSTDRSHRNTGGFAAPTYSRAMRSSEKIEKFGQRKGSQQPKLGQDAGEFKPSPTKKQPYVTPKERPSTGSTRQGTTRTVLVSSPYKRNTVGVKGKAATRKEGGLNPYGSQINDTQFSQEMSRS